MCGFGFIKKLFFVIILAASFPVYAWMPSAFHKYIDNEDYSSAYKIARTLAMAGNAEAKYWAAFLILGNTPGVSGDKAKARHMLLESANSNFASAQSHVASNYWRGDQGFAKNYDEAIRWYKKAYENGDKFSATSLGFVYYEIGNRQAAKHWLNISAVNGSKSASGMLDSIDGMEREESQRRSRNRSPIICSGSGDLTICY